MKNAAWDLVGVAASDAQYFQRVRDRCQVPLARGSELLVKAHLRRAQLRAAELYGNGVLHLGPAPTRPNDDACQRVHLVPLDADAEPISWVNPDVVGLHRHPVSQLSLD
eukprot:8719971-Pyramimonas_sp.AAC.1